MNTTAATTFITQQGQWATWLSALLILLVCWAAGFSLFRLVYHYFSKWAHNTSTYLDDIVIDSTRYHIILWSFLIGLYIAGKTAPLSAKITAFIGQSVLTLFLISLTIAAANIASLFIKNYGKKSNFSLPLTSLSDTLLRLLIIIIGGLVVLANLGISITPLLTALGVGSLAVALALQDTLSNLFAGFHILAGKQILPGNYIRLEGGQEGYVSDVGWRTTRIRELSNNIIIIPNTKLSTSIVTNYYFPGKDLSVVVNLGVSYASDLEKVERVTVEVARETLHQVQGAIPDFEPFIRYNAFGDSAMQFSVILRVKEFTDKFLVTHEFMKRLQKRYRQEGIEIPFPQRVIHTAQKQ